MSKFSISLVALSALLVLPLAARAQEEEAPSQSFVYATYFECETTDQWLVDTIVETVYKPIYDAAVEDGSISAWGWLAHHTGGKWRRGLYHIAPTVDALLDSSDAVGEKVGEANAQAARQFGEICPAHDDYIWRAVSGSSGAGSIDVATIPSKAGVSMYMVCDMAKQGRADEPMAEFATVYNSHVGPGKLTGWSWLEHQVGGEYRRLLAMRGADHKAVLAAWGAIVDELDEKHDAASTEFSEICYTHQDYMWDIVH
jgi:hypothetical protein